jgi:hypothetical protein
MCEKDVICSKRNTGVAVWIEVDASLTVGDPAAKPIA